jgi:hypothetical protein
MPPFLKSIEFLKAASLIVAALVAFFLPEYAVEAAVIETFVYAFLKLFFNVTPELRAKGLLK